MSKPNPGSQEAQDQGCMCPILDNEFGDQTKTAGMWTVVLTCKMHGDLLTEEHREHAAKIALDFQKEMMKKYEAGAREHGGHLKDMSAKDLIDNAIEEAIDTYIYLHELREKLIRGAQ